MPAYTLTAHADTHVGLLRTNNEDAVYADTAAGLFMVIDGLGGAAAGEVAAEIAREVASRRVRRADGDPEKRIREAIAQANNAVFRHSLDEPSRAGMGCVMTLALVENGTVHVGHVGDTRLYRIRNGKIEKMTLDHSVVGELEDQELLTEDEAMRHPRRHIILRDLGSEPRQPNDNDFIDYLSFRLDPPCTLLLCSDGLSDQVASQDILHVVRGASSQQEAVETLIARANDAGGKDNVSVVLVDAHPGSPPRRLSSWLRRNSS